MITPVKDWRLKRKAGPIARGLAEWNRQTTSAPATVRIGKIGKVRVVSCTQLAAMWIRKTVAT